MLYVTVHVLSTCIKHYSGDLTKLDVTNNLEHRGRRRVTLLVFGQRLLRQNSFNIPITCQCLHRQETHLKNKNKNKFNRLLLAGQNN